MNKQSIFKRLGLKGIPVILVLAIVFVFANSSLFAAKTDIDSPYEQKQMTQEPSTELKNNLFNFSNESTKFENYFNSKPETAMPINPRMIAEWEPMKAALIRYPLGIPLELVKLLSQESPVYVLVESSLKDKAIQNFQRAGVVMGNISFIEGRTDAYWTRDYAPWWIVEGKENERKIKIVDPIYYEDRKNDDDVPKLIADYLNESTYYPLNIRIQGGNVMSDSVGAGTSTTKVFTQNTDMTKDTIVNLTKNIIGFNPYYTVKDTTGTYIEHIDCWAKYITSSKILIRRVPKNNAKYAETEEAVKFFSNAKNGEGIPYTIVRVDSPKNEPFTNHLVLNDRVFVPIAVDGSSETDKVNSKALAQISEAYGSKYRVFGVVAESGHPWLSTDALHCRVNAIPDVSKILN